MNFPGSLNQKQTIYKLIFRRIKPTAPTRPVPNSNRVPGSGTAGVEFTVTLNDPVLLYQPNPSTEPRYSRVAPAGTINVCTVPEPLPVKPSPIKNVCCNSGDSVLKLSPTTPKSMEAGAGFEVGRPGPRKTPVSASTGTLIKPAILFGD